VTFQQTIKRKLISAFVKCKTGFRKEPKKMEFKTENRKVAEYKAKFCFKIEENQFRNYC
jgi:hypothetical protein